MYLGLQLFYCSHVLTPFKPSCRCNRQHSTLHLWERTFLNSFYNLFYFETSDVYYLMFSSIQAILPVSSSVASVQFTCISCILLEGKKNQIPWGLLLTSANHRIIERLGLNGVLQINLFQPLCHSHRCLSLDQVAQSLVDADLEHCRG